MVILGQNREMGMINRRNADFKKVIERFYGRLQYEDGFKKKMENLVNMGLNPIKDLESAANKLGQEVEKKKTEGEACKAEQVKNVWYLFVSEFVRTLWGKKTTWKWIIFLSFGS